MWSIKHKHKGFAMVLVIIIALALIVPAVAIASLSANRRKVVSGEAISDKVLSVADAGIERTLKQINTFPSVIVNTPAIQDGIQNINDYFKNHSSEAKPERVQKTGAGYVTAVLLSYLNGGTPYQPDGITDPYTSLQLDRNDYPGKNNIITGSLWDMEDNISTFLYQVSTNTFYEVCNGSLQIASVNATGINGDITSKRIKNLTTGVVKTGIAQWDPDYATDNDWIELDRNVQYIDTGNKKPGSTKFQIRVTAYPLSTNDVGHIQRSILAEATMNKITVSTSSVSGGSTNGSSENVGQFHYAVWSGKGFILNGVHKIDSGHRDSSGNIIHDGRNGHGDVYATGQIIMNGNNRVYGNILTSESKDNYGVVINGHIDMGKGHKIIYNHKEDMSDFGQATKDDIKATAMHASEPSPTGLDYMNSNSTININGGEIKYYYNGDVNIMGWDNTIVFYPVDNVGGDDQPKVDWYINGDLNINGDVTLDFGDTPGIVWVNGSINFNGNINIVGSGTIVAGGSGNGGITLNGYTDIHNNTGLVCFMDEGNNSDIILNGNNDVEGLFYAPHGDIILNGTGNVFGSLVAGGYVEGYSSGVIVNGNQNITYDTGVVSAAENNTIPPVPHQSTPTIEGVAYSSNTIYRLSWREIISDPVTVKNVQSFDPEFVFIKPST
jgi:hypothetical protein